MRKLCISLLTFLMALILVFSAVPMSAVAAQEVMVSTEADLLAAIEAIPEGGSGEIRIKDIHLQLSTGIYFERKDIVFNLENTQLIAIDMPVILALSGNVTVNADQNSYMETQGENGLGIVRVDNIDFDDASQSFPDTYHLAVNGGKYNCQEGDSAFVTLTGSAITLTDVVCNGKVESLGVAGFDVGGEITVNSGRFTNDISSFVPKAKWCGKQGDYWYVRDKEFSNEFVKHLTDGKLVFNYTTPTSADDSNLWLAVEEFNMNHEGEIYLSPESFNSDFSKCELGIHTETYREEIHTVDVVWNFDSEVKKVADKYTEKFPQEGEWFDVTDLELMNYWVNRSSDSESDIDTLPNYSGELRAILNNSNFLFAVDIRGGADDVFYTERIGSAKLMHNGKVYFSSGMLGARAEHAVYVPDTTGNTADELIAAAQKRIDDYIGKGKVKITLDSESVEDYYNNTLSDFDRELAAAQAGFAAESAKPENERDWSAYWEYKGIIDATPGYKQYFMESFQEGGDLYFLNSAAGGYLFNVEIGENHFRFIIIKSASLPEPPAFLTVDLNTNIQVNTTSSEVPLDTVVEVEKLTSGAEYERIIKLLDVKDNVTYDIKLHSNSLDKYVTVLENGSFEVKIPVPAELKGKTLVAYYVDKDNKIVDYDAPVDDETGLATFTTNHFSIYTLAEKGGSPYAQSPSTGDNAVPAAVVLTALLAAAFAYRKLTIHN